MRTTMMLVAALAAWTATADSPIAAGTTVKVISHNNLTMKVEEVK